MLKLELENKKGGKPTAAERLHKAERRIAEMDAELAELGLQAHRTERELGLAEPEEVEALETERSRIAGQRAKLEQERSTLEAALPEIRAGVGREEWAVEITKQEYLKRQFEETARELVEKVTVVADVSEKLEAIWHDNEDLNRRLITRAQRYGREPLAPLVSSFAHQLPLNFLDAVKQVAEGVRLLEVDRERDPLLGKPPVSDAQAERSTNRSMDGNAITPPVEPEPDTARGPRFFQGWFGNAAA